MKKLTEQEKQLLENVSELAERGGALTINDKGEPEIHDRTKVAGKFYVCGGKEASIKVSALTGKPGHEEACEKCGGKCYRNDPKPYGVRIVCVECAMPEILRKIKGHQA